MRFLPPILLLILLLLSLSAEAQEFTDDFDRANSIADNLGGSWTNTDGSRDRLQVLSNEIASQGTSTSVTGYLAPANSSADMYAQAEIAGFTNRNVSERVTVRHVDRDNLIGIGISSAGISTCGYYLANVFTEIGASDSNLSTTALRIEIEGTAVSCQRSISGGAFTEYASGTASDATFTSETSAGFRAAASGGVADVPLWDNFETGALEPPASGAAVKRRRQM